MDSTIRVYAVVFVWEAVTEFMDGRKTLTVIVRAYTAKEAEVQAAALADTWSAGHCRCAVAHRTLPWACITVPVDVELNRGTAWLPSRVVNPEGRMVGVDHAQARDALQKFLAWPACEQVCVSVTLDEATNSTGAKPDKGAAPTESR